MFRGKNYRLTSMASCWIKRNLGADQRGVYLVFSAIAVIAVFGFVALGIEVGRWYAIQSEISKSVDGAAFAGAANSGNLKPEELREMVENVAKANFQNGMLGTENLVVNVGNDGKGKITVNGDVDAVNPIARVLGASYNKTKVSSLGAAKLRKFEIVLVLDQSLSMVDGMDDLKTAATKFVQSFQSMESKKDDENPNRMGLISFASGVVKHHPLTAKFGPLTETIKDLKPEGHTNTEEAFARAQDPDMGWSDQTKFSPNERIAQYVIFFSDGQPSAFRAALSTNGSQPTDAGVVLYSGPKVLDRQNTSFRIGGDRQFPIPTGNGTSNGPRKNDCTGRRTENSWKWWILDPSYNQDGKGKNAYSVNQPMIYGEPNPVYGQSPIACIPKPTLQEYIKLVSQQMAVEHAATIKDVLGYKIYTIGVGQAEVTFLEKISSGNGFYHKPTSTGKLPETFEKIARQIKLVLLE